MATTCSVTLNSCPVLTGTYSPTTCLWNIDLPHKPATTNPTPPATSQHTPTLVILANQQRCRLHCLLPCCHSLSQPLHLVCGINAGRLTTWPNLMSTQVRRHPPRSSAMIKGHLDQQRANLWSTQPTPSPSSLATFNPANADDDSSPKDFSPVPSNPPPLTQVPPPIRRLPARHWSSLHQSNRPLPSPIQRWHVQPTHPLGL